MKGIWIVRRYLLISMCLLFPLSEAGLFSRLFYNMMRNKRREYAPYPLPLLTLAGLDGMGGIGGLGGLGGFGGLGGLGGLGPVGVPLPYNPLSNLAYGFRGGYSPTAATLTNSVEESNPSAAYASNPPAYMSSPIPAIAAYPARAFLGGFSPYDGYAALNAIYGLGAYGGYPGAAAAAYPFIRPDAAKLAKFAQFYDYNGDMKALKSESKTSTKVTGTNGSTTTSSDNGEQVKPKTKYSQLESIRAFNDFS